MRTLRDAIRAAARGAAGRPGFALLVILTLAIGIGANTAIFTVADATLRKGLPYPDPDRIVALFETRAREDFGRMEASYPNFLDWRESMRSYDGLAGYGARSFTLAGEGGAEVVPAAVVTGELFHVLGARAALGRLLTAADEDPAAPRVVVLSHAFWQSRFAGDRSVLGRTLTVQDEPHTIAGVLAPEFSFAPVDAAGLWTATRPRGGMRERRNLHWLNVVARLAPGVSRDQAQAEATTVAGRLEKDHPDTNEGGGIVLVPLADEILGRARPIMLLLLGAVGLVLLIACANVANLLLARQTGRAKELAVRAALGASRRQLVGLLTVEALAYSLAGGGLGVVLAMWGVDVLVGAVPHTVIASMPYLAAARVDLVALAVTFLLAVATGVAVGVTTAVRAARPDLANVLKDDGRASADPRRGRLRDALVVSEVALAFVLLAGAGLVGRSLLAVLATSPGFDTRELLTAEIRLPDAGYPEDPQAIAAHDELIRRLEALPGVRGVGSCSRLPLGNGGNTIRFLIAGKPPAAGELEPEANIRDVSAGYFKAMGIPVLDGRAFEAGDGPGAAPVVIVNQTLADRLFPGGAVGQSIVFTFATDQPPRRIVGVVGDERLGPLDVRPRPAVYAPYAQGPNAGIAFVIRGTARGEDVRRVVKQLDASIPIEEIASMDDRIAAAPWMFVRRFPAMLVGAFAALALLLTAVGIYGVLSYTVRQRRHEIGIRRAVGAGHAHILGMVLGRAALLAGIGLAIGLAGALAGGRLIGSMLFGVSPWDPLTLVVVGGGLLAISLVASWLPAHAALRVDPLEALR